MPATWRYPRIASKSQSFWPATPALETLCNVSRKIPPAALDLGGQMRARQSNMLDLVEGEAGLPGVNHPYAPAFTGQQSGYPLLIVGFCACATVTTAADSRMPTLRSLLHAASGATAFGYHCDSQRPVPPVPFLRFHAPGTSWGWALNSLNRRRAVVPGVPISHRLAIPPAGGAE